MRRCVVVGITSLLGSFLVLVAQAPAMACPGDDGEEVAGSLEEVTVECEYTSTELAAAQEGSDSEWELFQICADGTSGQGELCSNPRPCELRGAVGTWYIVRRDGVTVGRACLTATEATARRVDVRQLVIRAFARLDWPASDLIVQPPGGETLVNLETVFYTANTQPSTRVVTLAGHQVTVVADPESYTWHFGDGTSTTTSSPGHEYPGHDVFRVYTTTGDVTVSVDTTYRGSYSVDGGAWRGIPATRTIDGEPVDLTILEAKPQLVLR